MLRLNKNLRVVDGFACHHKSVNHAYSCCICCTGMTLVPSSNIPIVNSEFLCFSRLRSYYQQAFNTSRKVIQCCEGFHLNLDYAQMAACGINDIDIGALLLRGATRP